MLLTIDEIKEIELIVSRAPALRHKDVYTIWGDGYKRILKVTPKNGLIFIQGNSETGLEHINNRHQFFSTKQYWKEVENGDLKPDYPSKFSRKSIPILDYVEIADAVFSPENINTKRNHRPEQFDLYTGEYCEENGTSSAYHLLTYKDSKVVHTLYPQSQKNNKKFPDKFKFVRGEVSVIETLGENLSEIKIPYLSGSGKIVYSILIRKHADINIEQAFILIHDGNQKEHSFVFIAEREIQLFQSKTHELITYQHTDLRALERQIMWVDENLKKGN